MVRKSDMGVEREVNGGIKSRRLAHVNAVTHKRAKGATIRAD